MKTNPLFLQVLLMGLPLLLGAITSLADAPVTSPNTFQNPSQGREQTARFAGALAHVGDCNSLTSVEAKLKCVLKADALGSETELIEILFD